MHLVPKVWRPMRHNDTFALPHAGEPIAAGFPSPAADYAQDALDIHDYLVARPLATFLFNVAGDSMKDAGILDGDKVVVDKSVAPQSGQIVVAVVDGQFTLKRLWRRGQRVELRAENAAYPPIVLQEGQELQIWGVVVGVVRRYWPRS
ncbi:unnamed protein product [Darwinula stevensoni]|uniref:Peptidase S24/S26A/S26B/S26C domain-containing protein n=1 Tax=Darwinula stevensoni TaxID=69355 RepID=A0A7R9AJD8_9CRUS|nr:unnamed protein product [Darwinula stevensoni]CAG0908699.1 unnamed protein product [Darwinula stevensoni]